MLQSEVMAVVWAGGDAMSAADVQAATLDRGDPDLLRQVLAEGRR
jgi:hypothetical protein